MRRLHPGNQREAFLALVVAAERGPRLHRVDGDPRDAQALPHHVARARERRVDRGLVADRFDEADVVGNFIPHRRRPRRDGGGRIGDRRPRVVIDSDELGCVLRGRDSLGDDRRHRVADQMDAIERERAKARLEARAAVGALAAHARGQRADAVGLQISAGEDRDDARRRPRRGGVDPRDARRRMRRAQHVEMRLSRQRNVVGEPAASAQELEILDPRH